MKQLINNFPPIEIDLDNGKYAGIHTAEAGKWACEALIIVTQSKQIDWGGWDREDQIVAVETLITIDDLKIWLNDYRIDTRYLDPVEKSQLKDAIRNSILDRL